MNVLIIGNHPPPIGGVSVHVQRLASGLTRAGHQVKVVSLSAAEFRHESDVTYELVALGMSRWRALLRLLAILRRSRHDVVHLHVSGFGNLRLISPAFSFFARRHALVITIHSGSWPFSSRVRRIVDRVWLGGLLRSARQIICVNERQRRELVYGFGCKPGDTSVIPAFLPGSVGTMPPYLEQVLNRWAREGRACLVMSGYCTPLYRFEDGIRAIDDADDAQRYGLVIAIYGHTDEEYRARLEAMAAGKAVVFIRNLEPQEFLAVLSAADVYLRASTTDGDSVAVREALSLGIPTIASDAVERPAEAILFRVGDVNGLVAALRLVAGTSRSNGRQSGLGHHYSVSAIADVYLRGARS